MSMEFEGSEAGIVKNLRKMKVLGNVDGLVCGKPHRGAVRFGPVGRARRLPALISGSRDQARRVQKDGPGGGIGCVGPGKGPGAPNLTFSTIFEPGRAVSAPWRNSLLRPATPPRTFIFLRFFTIPASEPSNSTEISTILQLPGP